MLPDSDDTPFYEVVLEKRDDNAYLVTGNIKHFPKKTFIVTAAEFLNIIDGKKQLIYIASYNVKLKDRHANGDFFL